MGQITLYLDDETEKKMKAAARAAGISLSRWVNSLIRERTAEEWPASVARLAGAWADLSTVEEIRRGQPDDAPREPL